MWHALQAANSSAHRCFCALVGALVTASGLRDEQIEAWTDVFSFLFDHLGIRHNPVPKWRETL